MPKINKTKYAVLGMLSLGPMSGYDMKKRFDSSVAHFWNENYGHIYPVLKRLERGKLVAGRTERTEGKPSRTVYSITKKGRAELSAWLLLPAERPILRIELLLKLFFGSQVPPSNLIAKVEEEKAFCERALAAFREIEAHIDREVSNAPVRDAAYWLVTLDYGTRYYRAVASWCEETLRTLDRLKDTV